MDWRLETDGRLETDRRLAPGRSRGFHIHGSPGHIIRIPRILSFESYPPDYIHCIITSNYMCCSQTFTCGIRNRSCICCIRSRYCICHTHSRYCICYIHSRYYRSCIRSFLLLRQKPYVLPPGRPSLQRMTGCTGYWHRNLPYIPASTNCSCDSRHQQMLCWRCSRRCFHRLCSHNKLHFHNNLHSHNRYRWQHLLRLHSRLPRQN